MAVSDIFRVKIDLGQFYSDYKSQAYVSVNPEWKNVRQFHRHITEMFDVKKFVLLTDDGVYLPGLYISQQRTFYSNKIPFYIKFRQNYVFMNLFI